MPNLHPNWHATDTTAGEQRAPTSVNVQHSALRTANNYVSRRPAAVFGISIVLAMGFVFIQGVESLTGQLAQVTDIIITADGLVPNDVIVNPGDTISWTNEQDIPHILESTTLCDASGNCLLTSTMFQGDTADYTVPTTLAPGNYEYESTTSADIMGTITISGDAGSNTSDIDNTSSVPAPIDNSFPDITSLLRDSLTGTDPLDAFNNARRGIPPPPPPPPPPVRPPAGGGLSNIPRNPYTVGSNRTHPYSASGNPAEDANSTLVAAVQQKDDMDVAARRKIATKKRPGKQPATGAPDAILWSAIVLAVLGLMYGVKRFTGKVVVK